MIELRDDWTDAAAWDAFVDAHPEARYCQLFGYGSVVACYGYRPRQFAFLRNGTLVGVLPAVEVTSLLYGRRLVSQPFSEYGGVLFDPALDDAERDAALHRLLETLRRCGRTLELHGNHGLAEMPADLAAADEVGHIAVMKLTADTEAMWRDTVRYSVRKAVRQAQDYGVTVAFDCTEDLLRRDFFPLYLKSMQRLGVPPHKPAYYLRSLQAFGARMILATARQKDGVPIAGLLGFACGGRVNIINTVSDPAYWNLKANDLLHWEMIRRVAAAGHARFDFGSVRYEGQSTYKKKWGTELAPHRNYLLAAGARAERRGMVRSSSSAMQRMSRLWSSYMPGPIGQRLGPLIRGQLAR